MKKLFLVVIGLVLMAGAIFSPSKSWGFTPDNEICFLSEHVPPGDLCILNNKITLATNQDPTEELIFSAYNDSINAVVTHNPELGVSCINHTCLDCSVVNHKHDITNKSLVQKRVNILNLC